MCNWSEAIWERGMETERLNAIERMIQAGATKEQILSFGYTEKEFTEVESALCANAQVIIVRLSNAPIIPTVPAHQAF